MIQFKSEDYFINFQEIANNMIFLTKMIFFFPDFIYEDQNLMRLVVTRLAITIFNQKTL